jgi:hypothetical protein
VVCPRLHPDENIYELITELSINLSSDHDSAINKYSFVANGTLGGGQYPCSHHRCRLDKLNEMASFAAFYADTVYIKDPFEEILLHDKESLNRIDRSNI